MCRQRYIEDGKARKVIMKVLSAIVPYDQSDFEVGGRNISKSTTSLI